jgi:error-prone DNA polymerase
LILTGGFDSLHADVNRRDLLLHFSDLQKSPGMAVSGAQMNLGFDPPALISSGLAAMTPAESVKYEVDRLGIDMSRHMIEFYGDFLNAIGAVRSSDLLKQRSQSSVLVAGIKVAMQTPPVRSGKRVIFLTLDDGYGLSDSTFFTDVQGEYANVLYSTSLLLVRGVTRRTGARGISIRATGAWDLRAAYESWSTKQSTLAI